MITLLKTYTIATLCSYLLMFTPLTLFKKRLDRYEPDEDTKYEPKIRTMFRLLCIPLIPFVRIAFIIGVILIIAAPDDWVTDYNDKIDGKRNKYDY